MRNTHNFSAILIALFSILPATLCAQTQPLLNSNQRQNVDSLINVLNTQKLTPKEQLVLYENICRNLNNDIEKSAAFAEKGLALAEKQNDKTRMSLFSTNLGDSYCLKGDYDKGLVYFEKAIAFAQEAKNEDYEANAYVYIAAHVYMMKSMYEESLKYNMKAMSLYEKTGNKSGYLIAVGNIASIHMVLFDYERAIYYFEQSIAMAEELNDTNGKIGIYYNLGATYINMGEFDKAEVQELKALEIARSVGAFSYEAYIMSALAGIYADDSKKDYDKAEEYAKEALRLAEESGIPAIVVNAKLKLAGIYYYQKRYKESDAAASMVYEMDSINIERGRITTASIVVANIFLGNKDKAAYFFKKYDDFVKQFNDESLHNSLLEMEVKYETEKKELQISALEKEKVFYIWLGIIGGTLLLSLLILFIVLRRMAVNKRKLAEQQTIIAEQQIKHLEQQQQIIAAQSVMDGETAERTRLARDLHDGLGGMLSVVKLNLTDLEHLEKARELLDQSINELRRVAHHLMPESLLRYGLKTALEDFCKSAPNVKFHYFGNESHLDDRIEVLIYRCAHELVNNAIKYANASTINVQLVQDPDLILLTVEDDGCGFDTETANPGMGLENLRTRVAAYNGKINLFSSPDKGTEVSVELALQQNLTDSPSS
jgi:signal transduction histidine kinase/uncharacterized protein HemY